MKQLPVPKIIEKEDRKFMRLFHTVAALDVYSDKSLEEWRWLYYRDGEKSIPEVKETFGNFLTALNFIMMIKKRNSRGIESIFNNEKCYDFKIHDKMTGQSFTIYKGLLIEESGFFKTLINSGNFIENTSNQLEIEETDEYNFLHTVCSYLYGCSDIIIECEAIYNYYSYAKKYDFDNIANDILELVLCIPRIDVVYYLFVTLNCLQENPFDDLCDVINRLVSNKLKEFVNSKLFFNLDNDHLLKFLKITEFRRHPRSFSHVLLKWCQIHKPPENVFSDIVNFSEVNNDLHKESKRKKIEQ